MIAGYPKGDETTGWYGNDASNGNTAVMTIKGGATVRYCNVEYEVAKDVEIVVVFRKYTTCQDEQLALEAADLLESKKQPEEPLVVVLTPTPYKFKILPCREGRKLEVHRLARPPPDASPGAPGGIDVG